MPEDTLTQLQDAITEIAATETKELFAAFVISIYEMARERRPDVRDVELEHMIMRYTFQEADNPAFQDALHEVAEMRQEWEADRAKRKETERLAKSGGYSLPGLSCKQLFAMPPIHRA